MWISLTHLSDESFTKWVCQNGYWINITQLTASYNSLHHYVNIAMTLLPPIKKSQINLFIHVLHNHAFAVSWDSFGSIVWIFIDGKIHTGKIWSKAKVTWTIGLNMKITIINCRLVLISETHPKIQYNSSDIA